LSSIRVESVPEFDHGPNALGGRHPGVFDGVGFIGSQSAAKNPDTFLHKSILALSARFGPVTALGPLSRMPNDQHAPSLTSARCRDAMSVTKND